VLQEEQVLTHSTWLERQNNKIIAPEIFPVGNPAQHKHPKASGVLADAMCLGRRTKHLELNCLVMLV